jgi:cell division protein FtsB
MHEYERKRKMRQLKRRIYSYPTLAILVILLLFALQNVWSVGQKALQTEAVAQEAAAGLAELEEREARLTEQIEELKTPFGVEAEIREKYGYVKEGEEMVVVTDARVEEELEPEIEENPTLLERFINWF